MNGSPRIGTAGELTYVVEAANVIDFASDGMPAVLSTPQLIGWLERTARRTLEPFLEANERSVGMEVEVRHLAPTGIGARVTCVAKVIQVDGRQVGFQLEARDEQELLSLA